MLIYNYQKEFLGIDENDLKSLGFSDFAHLRNEAADFADFFVKTPGFVHNFKHVHWIDFVTCAEGSEDSKVIIHANGKNYRCTLDIRVAYLIDNPTQKAYLIHLMNLRALTHAENEQVAGDILERPTIKTSNESKAIFGTPEFINDNDFEDTQEVNTDDLDNEVYLSNDPYETTAEETYYDDSPIDLGDDFLVNDEVQKEEPEEKIEEKVEPVIQTNTQKEVKKVQIPTQVLDVGSDYVYDPHLASDELGLPVDLIEEFIQDFISQANEFKDELYTSLKDNNISNLKILSHKLKGVAANLRVEDAFEVLTTINTSEDTEVIEINLNTLYVIIDRLAGKSPQFQNEQEKEEAQQIEEESTQDDDIVLSFKDDIEDEKKTEELQEIFVEAPVFEDEIPVEERIEVSTDIDKKLELDYDDLQEDNEEPEPEPEPIVVHEAEIEQPAENIELEVESEVEEITKEIEPILEDEVEQISESLEVETESEVMQITEEPEIEPEIEEIPENIEFESNVLEEKEVEITDNTVETSSQSSLEYEDLSYDKVLVANEIGINLEVFNELFEDYISEASKACNDISIAIENNDTSAWQKSAIKLKGMSDNMRVHDIVAELKSIIHTSDVDIAKKAVGIVASKLQQISKTEV